MKTKIFVGSSSESARYAENICLNLDNSVEVDFTETIFWRNSSLFKGGHYILEDLINTLHECSFGIFVFSPDDLIEIREKNYYTTRDNVLFEAGMSIGMLGRNRTFILVPKKQKDSIELHLLSDIDGLITISYNYKKEEKNVANLVRNACVEIKNNLIEFDGKALIKDIIEKYDVFNGFEKRDFNELFSDSSTLVTCFIHSRKWRESNQDIIDNYMKRKDTSWVGILPDINNHKLMAAIKECFDDGKTIHGMIINAYEYFYNMMNKFGDRVQVYVHSFYPRYSFYKFDNKILVSLYPLTDERKSTPTFLINLMNDASDFFQRDIESILSHSKKLNVSELKDVIDTNLNDGGKSISS